MKRLLITALITLSMGFATSCMKGKQNPIGGKYTGPRAEVAMHYALEEYGRQTAKANDMQFLIAGDTTDDKGITYCLTFRTQQTMRLEKGRLFATRQVQDFLTMLQACPEVKTFNAFVKKQQMAQIENVGYKIVFWDDSTKRVQKPYIAQILFSNKTFYFYRTDPKTQKLELIFKEAYVDALHNLSHFLALEAT